MNLSFDRLLTLACIGLFVLMTGSLYFYSPLSADQQSDLEKLSNAEMREVSGQHLLNFTVEQGQNWGSGSFSRNCAWYCTNNYDVNIDNTDFTFARIEMDLNVTANYDGGDPTAAYIDGLKLGHYDDGGYFDDFDAGYCTSSTSSSGFQNCHGSGSSWYQAQGSKGWDVDAAGVYLGHRGRDAPEIVGPYVELVYENFDSDFSRELVGFRFGADKIRGSAGLGSTNTVSGSVRGDDFGSWGSANCSQNRISGCSIGLMNTLELGADGGNAGDGDGWTEDFWISFNARDIFYEYNNPAAEAGLGVNQQAWHTDGKGFWIHLTDDVEGGL